MKNDYNKKSIDELTTLLNEKREEVRVFRFDITGSTKKNVKGSSASRKETARILTELNLRKNSSLEVTA